MLRWLICGLAIVGTALEARAADLGDSFLRGSSTVINTSGGTRWDGFYVGGQVGMNVNGLDFTDTSHSVSDLLLRPPSAVVSASATPLGQQNTRSTHFGGFVGYNVQWEGAVIGVEGNYNWLDTTVTATNFVSGTWRAPAGTPNDFAGPGSSSARLIDYGTLRVRGGWAAGSFMPYATIGLAIGRADISRTVTENFTAPGITSITMTDSHPGLVAYGYAAGLGVDFCVLSNLFLRAEYEYVQFGNFDGLNLHLHNVRVAAAFKF